MGAGTVTIEGTLNSIPGESFVLHFYRSSTVHPSGAGEAVALLGSLTVTTSHIARVRGFRVTLPAVGELSGQYFTATASRVYSSNVLETSEFSAAIRAP